MTPLLLIIPIVMILGLCIAVIMSYHDGVSIKSIVGIVTGVVLISSVAIPLISSEPAVADEWEYDDYSYSPNVTEASGALELLTINGKNYLHASDVGEGEYVTSSGTFTINVHKARLDVFMIAGQSNAAYSYYDAATTSPIPKLGEGYYYGTQSSAVTLPLVTNLGYSALSMHDMIDTQTGHNITGHCDTAFAAKYSELTGHKTYVVNVGIPGKGVQYFTPGQDGYEYIKSTWAEALSAVDADKYDLSIKSYIWIQGEANADTSISAYKGYFLKMHNALIGKTSGFNDDGHYFESALISQVRSVNAPSPSIAQEQLAIEWGTSIKLATTISQTFTISNRLMLEDDLHYSQLGQNLIGVKVAEYAITCQ